VREEIARREDRLARLAEAKAVLETRAKERTAIEQADDETRLAQRGERERTTGRRPGGRPPTPVLATWDMRSEKSSMSKSPLNE
jgi:hypothetical protein